MQHRLNAADHTLELTFTGDVLSTNAAQLRTEVFEVLDAPTIKDAGWTTLQLNLQAAKMVDSVGLNLIVSLYKEAKKRGVKTSALVGSPNVQRTFVFTRLDAYIEITMVK